MHVLYKPPLTEGRLRPAIRAVLRIRFIDLIATLMHKRFLFCAFVFEWRSTTDAVPVFLLGNVLASDAGLKLILRCHIFIPLKFVDALLQVYSNPCSSCS